MKNYNFLALFVVFFVYLTPEVKAGSPSDLRAADFFFRGTNEKNKTSYIICALCYKVGIQPEQHYAEQHPEKLQDLTNFKAANTSTAGKCKPSATNTPCEQQRKRFKKLIDNTTEIVTKLQKQLSEIPNHMQETYTAPPPMEPYLHRPPTLQACIINYQDIREPIIEKIQKEARMVLQNLLLKPKPNSTKRESLIQTLQDIVCTNPREKLSTAETQFVKTRRDLKYPQ